MKFLIKAILLSYAYELEKSSVESIQSMANPIHQNIKATKYLTMHPNNRLTALDTEHIDNCMVTSIEQVIWKKSTQFVLQGSWHLEGCPVVKFIIPKHTGVWYSSWAHHILSNHPFNVSIECTCWWDIGVQCCSRIQWISLTHPVLVDFFYRLRNLNWCLLFFFFLLQSLDCNHAKTWHWRTVVKWNKLCAYFKLGTYFVGSLCRTAKLQRT